MCSIVQRRKSDKNVFLVFDNEELQYLGVKRLPIESYKYALKLWEGKENPDFLFMVAKDSSERNLVESYNAKPF